MIGLARGTGSLLMGHPITVQLCAGVIVVVTLGLMATEWRWVSRRIVKR